MADLYEITNKGFEDGETDWTFGAGVTVITQDSPPDGTHVAQFTGELGPTYIIHDKVGVNPGKSITASAYYGQGAADSGRNIGRVVLRWYNAAEAEIGTIPGNAITTSSGGYQKSTVTAIAPDDAAFVAIGGLVVRDAGHASFFDLFAWNHTFTREATLTYPVDGVTYVETSPVPMRITVSGTGPEVISVQYRVDGVNVGAPVTVAPFNHNETLTDGIYDADALVTFDDGTVLTTNTNTFTVSDVPPTPDTTREYLASNSFTYLVAENFANLASSIPSTALITGVEITGDYTVRALVRSLDVGVPAANATSSVAFDITDGGVIEAVLLNKESASSYSTVGTAISESIPLDRADYTVVEEGTTMVDDVEHLWTMLDSVPAEFTMGTDNSLFGSSPVALADFLNKSIGLRFYPVLGTKPFYADAGDAAFRFFLNRLRLRVYFDAGSALYYFASPDKTQVIKGELVASNVLDGRLTTGDASGELQLGPDLEVMDGTQTWIDADWTVHSAYPPTDSNQIAEVDERGVNDTLGMAYNGLPGYMAIVKNRSRYEFISANFYGDQALDSIYGVHGLPRAFSYNGEYFYKIYTQPDPIKDSPRHIESHHQHLALGYKTGNVDISVAGQPYNFDGAQGASSWAIGDKVVGLLELSGTILGVFGSKSVWGISGTTVDNFATQVIAPKIGAIEYTVADMGFPVYANAYGVYTLAQTQQYGDYLGSPMSQSVSPWLRPRLSRKAGSNKEVVVAWPVRAKNQYRLAFKDGYVLSMTINNGQQAAPTFSKQKYFLTPPDENPDLGIPLMDYPSMVPIAVSSELDDSGEERIHMAAYLELEPASTVITGPDIEGAAPNGEIGKEYVGYAYTLTPGSAPIVTCEVISGVLPAGLTLSNSGVLSGTPTALTGEEGVTFTVRVIDVHGLYDDLVDTIVITVAAGVMMAIGAGVGTLVTEDGGLTWTVTDNFPHPGATLLWAVTPDRFHAATRYTDDLGVTEWDTKTGGGNIGTTLTQRGNYVVFGASGPFEPPQVSADRGTTCVNAGATGNALYSVVYVGDTGPLLGVGNNNGMIMASTDNGATFVSTDTPHGLNTQNTSNACVKYSGGAVFAGSNDDVTKIRAVFTTDGTDVKGGDITAAASVSTERRASSMTVAYIGGVETILLVGLSNELLWTQTQNEAVPTWNIISNPLGVGVAVQAVAWNGIRVVLGGAIADVGVLKHSTDLVTWEDATFPAGPQGFFSIASQPPTGG